MKMEYNLLGDSDLNVSKICLGSMTWGEQNTQEEGFEQLDYAIAQGINFIDTAELYPVPAGPETQGATETIIGNWMKARGNRDQLIIASKIAGPAAFTAHIRNGSGFDANHINQAIEGSLQRLGTDCIDLYQLHWPERSTNYFGQLEYVHDQQDPWTDNIQEVLTTLSSLVEQGKIRHIGLSNETPWGLNQFLKYAELSDLPKVVSVQNPYSLVNRSYEMGMAEISIRENVPLLAYSPLAFGTLSGKYLNGQLPPEARLTRFKGFGRYKNEQALVATQHYSELAATLNVSVAQLALAFTYRRRFMGSVIIGARTMDQLKENIGAFGIELSGETFTEINRIHRLNPNPAP